MSSFKYNFYEKILRKFIKNDYIISSFENFSKKNKKTLILRHDVDYTINGVLEFANIEKKLGISSTFFFRLHANEYNIFEAQTYQLIKYLKKIGHEIGLHSEIMNFSRAVDENPLHVLKKEKKILESITGLKIKSFSEHRDISNKIHNTKKFHDVYSFKKTGFKFNAMEDKFFKEMKYLSDSNANWREGNPLKFINKHNRFQILIHPDWWFKKDYLLKDRNVYPTTNMQE